MKAMVLFVMFMGIAALPPQQKQEDFGLPELHKIKTATLGPSYSCRSRESAQGYADTALFLSGFSRRRNSPDLLFNGACGSKDNFQNMTAGDDMGVIADLGEVPLENLSVQLLFNTRNVNSFDLYSKFAQSVEVRPNHTYAVLINGSEIRGMFVFTVTGYVPNKKLELKYAVKHYMIVEEKAHSPGVDWQVGNH